MDKVLKVGAHGQDASGKKTKNNDIIL